MNWRDYLEMTVEDAKRVCTAYGLPYTVCVAQGALESTWGRDGIGNGGFNIFGRKYGGDFDYVVCKTQEDDETGNLYTIDAKFVSYPSMGDAINDWCQLMIWRSEDGSVDYKKWSDAYINQEIDLEGFVRGISAIYATDIYYADKIMEIINDEDCGLLE